MYPDVEQIAIHLENKLFEWHTIRYEITDIASFVKSEYDENITTDELKEVLSYLISKNIITVRGNYIYNRQSQMPDTSLKTYPDWVWLVKDHQFASVYQDFDEGKIGLTYWKNDKPIDEIWEVDEDGRGRDGLLVMIPIHKL
jgi:hypothetical protein